MRSVKAGAPNPHQFGKEATVTGVLPDWKPALAGAIMVLAGGWTHPGGDPGHSKYVPLESVTPDTVRGMERAWTFRTGDHAARPDLTARWKFQVTPILFTDRLIFCSPRNEVFALDPGTGAPLWRHDPQVDDSAFPSVSRVCRGVTPWTDAAAAPDAPCRSRVFTTTVDRRLIALDARTGRRCVGFGAQGEVTVRLEGAADSDPLALTFVSPPAVAGDTVLIGSAIPDGVRTDAPSGKLRAYDARTGAPMWTWDPVPQSPDDPRWDGWLDGSAARTGAANAWAPLSADEARGWFFVPTGSASPDYYGGERPGLNGDANSVVALDAKTGERIWAFQTVHHDIWDYDVSAPPTLITVDRGEGPQDLVVQPTKMGFVFVLDRETGRPVFGVEERPVPASDVEGEWTAPTQPVPVRPRPLLSETVTSYGLTALDGGACRDLIEGLRYRGLFTPPSLEGTMVHPFSGGGMNWGGGAYHPERQILVLNTSDAAEYARLIPRKDGPETIRGQRFEQTGTPYRLDRGLVASPLGVPCTNPPWGRLHAIDMVTGEELWRTPFGTFEDIAPFGDLILPHGTPAFGGPLVTRHGVIFIAAAMDNYLRAFDLGSGTELWKGRLPAGGQASPMGYRWQGRDYVVIAAGGHGLLGTTPGDAIVAFALNPEGRGPGLLAWWDRPTPRRAVLALVGLVIVFAGLTGVMRWHGKRRRARP